MHSNDHLVLEDESGRVKLSGPVLTPAVYVTGIVVALHGKETCVGDFLVLDILEAGLFGLATPVGRPLVSSQDKFVVFVSGLSIGSSISNPLLFQLLIDHLTGHLGDEKEQGIAALIVHVVICGNLVERPRALFNWQNLFAKDQTKLTEPLKELYILLNQLAACLPVDIMPGSIDPANFALPQQAKDKLEFMGRTLRWRHLAPTAPNTLGCYPFTDRDPFLIESCPHVYFIGNQDKFDTRSIKGPEGQLVRLISVPRFREKGVAVMGAENKKLHASKKMRIHKVMCALMRILEDCVWCKKGFQ